MKNLFHDSSEEALFPITWEVESVPEDFIINYDDDIGAGDNDITTTSEKDELDHTRLMKLYQRY